MSLTLFLSSPQDTEVLAQTLAPLLEKGDILGLAGDLGTGKSTFARALIQTKTEGPVPSPTFTLVQTYEFGGKPLWHLDLYRLKSPEETEELGLEEAFATAITLIEWPDRLGPYLPSETLLLTFQEGAQPHCRLLQVHIPSPWQSRLARVDFSPWALPLGGAF
jgi:tRNA threonylcarbamoyladenosine biosynthesis protein TsaE